MYQLDSIAVRAGCVAVDLGCVSRENAFLPVRKLCLASESRADAARLSAFFIQFRLQFSDRRPQLQPLSLSLSLCLSFSVVVFDL